MKIINIGSLNIDYVYKVPHFVSPGETLQSLSFARYCGGKGNNQSIALGRAGAKVMHAGLIGEDALWLKSILNDSSVNTRLIKTTSHPTGHAIIQVNNEGENCIIIFGGSNREFTEGNIDEILSACEPGDMVILQNEINMLSAIINKAKTAGAEIAFNPAPYTSEVADLPLENIKWFFLNEVEGEQLTGAKEPEKIGEIFLSKYPDANLILTLGAQGSIYFDSNQTIRRSAHKVKAVDTTAAGDTFIGYFLAGVQNGMNIKQCLDLAGTASAISVTRAGAADSIPWLNEVMNFAS